MLIAAAASTLAQLALVALPVLVGFLAGRHIRQRHIDELERDAWHDGFQACIDVMFGHLADDKPGRIGGQLDAAVEQTPHPSDPWWN